MERIKDMTPGRIALACLASLLLAGCAALAPAEAVPAPSTDAPCEHHGNLFVHHADGRVAPRGAPAWGCLFHSGWAGNELNLGIGPDGTLFLDSWSWLDSPARLLTSADGRHWTRSWPQVAGQPAHTGSADPFLYVDPDTGRAFLGNLAQAPVCAYLSFTDDKGATWATTVAGCGQSDPPKLFGGPPATSSPAGYPNVLYLCASNGGPSDVTMYAVACQKSLEGGLTWRPTGGEAFVTRPGSGNYGEPVCATTIGKGAVAGDGTLYLPASQCGSPLLAISRDEGLTWTQAQVSTMGLPRMPHSGYPGGTSVAVDEAGNVYYFWSGPGRLPRLAISRDGGATWGAPLNVSAPGLHQAELTSITAGGPGRIAFSYMGSRNAPLNPPEGKPDCLSGTDCFRYAPCVPVVGCVPVPATPGYENATWDGYLSTSTDALSEDPTFLTVTVNPAADPLMRGECLARCGSAFDFLDIQIAPDGSPWAAFTDGCMLECIHGTANSDDHHEAAAAHLVGGPSLLES